MKEIRIPGTWEEARFKYQNYVGICNINKERASPYTVWLEETYPPTEVPQEIIQSMQGEEIPIVEPITSTEYPPTPIGEIKTAEQFYDEERKKGNTYDITSNNNPQYSLPFYQSIFRLMERFANQQPSDKQVLLDAILDEIDSIEQNSVYTPNSAFGKVIEIIKKYRI